MLSGLSRIFRKPFANVHISRKVAFAHVWQIYACGPRSCKTFHGFLHGVQHECLTQALTRTVAGFTMSCLIFFRPSFKYKPCDTNSSDLSVWSSFAPFCICTAVPNGLPVVAFADSKRSHCKWIPNDSKPLLN